MDLQFGCCICNEDIEDMNESVRLVVVVRPEVGYSQTWWAHGRCIPQAIHPHYHEWMPELEALIDKEG